MPCNFKTFVKTGRKWKLCANLGKASEVKLNAAE